MQSKGEYQLFIILVFFFTRFWHLFDSFVYSFNKYFLDAFSVPGAIERLDIEPEKTNIMEVIYILAGSNKDNKQVI